MPRTRTSKTVAPTLETITHDMDISLSIDTNVPSPLALAPASFVFTPSSSQESEPVTPFGFDEKAAANSALDDSDMLPSRFIFRPETKHAMEKFVGGALGFKDDKEIITPLLYQDLAVKDAHEMMSNKTHIVRWINTCLPESQRLVLIDYTYKQKKVWTVQDKINHIQLVENKKRIRESTNYVFCELVDALFPNQRMNIMYNEELLKAAIKESKKRARTEKQAEKDRQSPTIIIPIVPVADIPIAPVVEVVESRRVLRTSKVTPEIASPATDTETPKVQRAPKKKMIFLPSDSDSSDSSDSSESSTISEFKKTGTPELEMTEWIFEEMIKTLVETTPEMITGSVFLPVRAIFYNILSF